MTQEDKDLLFRDLCARIPYNVKCYNSKYRLDLAEEIICITVNYNHPCIQLGTYLYKLEQVKPYLFPLSSMTEEQLFEVQEILGKNEIEIEDGFLNIVDSDRNTITYLEILALLEWFYKNHFDIYGLIPMGLAIDATNLNIY